MYKKVTHHIIEEHFDHPMAAHVKEMIDNCQPMAGENLLHPYSPHTVSPHDHKSMYMPTLTPSATKFTSDTLYLFWNYFLKLRSYLTNAMDSGTNLTTIESQLFSDITSLGNEVKTYYGDAAAASFDQYLKAYLISIIHVINAIKAGHSTTDLMTKITSSITDLANFLSTANPVNWPASVVTHILNQDAAAWVSQATDRKSKKWIADVAALEAAKGIMLTGQPDKTPGFANIFINGIIHQFPSKFTS
jgi:hypothetical protein